MEENYHSLGYWIRRRRKALDLTRAGLAVLVSCSPETIKKIERDERRPSPQIAGLLAEALGLSDLEQEAFLQVCQQKRMPDSLDLIEGSLDPFPTRYHNNLPAQTTPFIGRESELSQIAAWLADPNCRLVILTGPGGIGKTRLALRAAEEQRGNYQSGVCFVTLVGIERPQGLIEAIAASLELPRNGSEDPQALVLRYLKNKEVLLVLDNYEQLLPETGLLTSLLQSARRLDLLVTSRERLNLQSEWVIPLDGLAAPSLEESSVLERYSSVALFVQAAGRQQAGFKIDESNRRAVAQICRQVEGLPLAIELAAAWIPVLEPQGIAEGIARGLDILEADLGDMPERQRSMRAVFDGSWKLLSEQDQRAVQQLAVFRGGFSQAAAEAAFGISIRLILGFVNKCWLRPESNGRFGLHELVRQYAEQRALEKPGLWVSIRESHCAFFCHLLKSRRPEWFTSKEKAFVAEIEADFQNIEAAWSWAIENCRVDHIAAASETLFLYLDKSGRVEEAKAATQATIECLAGSSHDRRDQNEAVLCRARAMIWSASFSDTYEQKDQRRNEASAFLDLLEQSGCDTRAERARILWEKAELVYGESPQLSLDLASQAAELYRAVGDKSSEGRVYGTMGSLYWLFGCIEQASDFAYESMRVLKELDPDWLKSEAYAWAGDICRERGDLVQAERYHRESVAVNQELGFYTYDDINLTDTLVLAGKFEEAIKRAEAELRSAEMIGSGPFRISLASKNLTWALLHSGKFSRARSFGEISLKEARKINSYTKILALNLLAQLDLLEDQTEAALERLQECLEYLKSYKQFIYTSTPLTVLSYVFLRRKQADQAEGQLRSSLQEAARIGAFHLGVNALPALALLEAARGKHERAIEVYEVALQFPYIANSKYFEQVAGKRISALKVGLPVHRVEAAVERGRSLNMWQVIQDWLGEVLTGAGLVEPATQDLEVNIECGGHTDVFFSGLRDLLKHHE